LINGNFNPARCLNKQGGVVDIIRNDKTGSKQHENQAAQNRL